MVVELIKGKKFAKKDGSLVDVDQILKEKKVTFLIYFVPLNKNNKNDFLHFIDHKTIIIIIIIIIFKEPRSTGAFFTRDIS